MEADRWRKMILILGALGLLSCLVITPDDETKSRCSFKFQSPMATRTRSYSTGCSEWFEGSAKEWGKEKNGFDRRENNDRLGKLSCSGEG